MPSASPVPGVEQQASLARRAHDPLRQPVAARERRARLAVRDELDADQQAAAADLADVRVVVQPIVEQRLQPVALRGARLDQVLVLEDPQDLAGDRRADGVVRVREPVDEARRRARTSATAPDAATNPNGK